MKKNTEAMETDTENEEKAVLEAETVYLLMKKGFPISRNVRAQWMLEHLNTTITIQRPGANNEETPELEIISVLPVEQPPSWRGETSYRYQYKITTNTSLVFLAHKYRIVISLDLSPSLSTVDIQHGEIVMDEIYMATKRCLEGITRPFVVPGSERVMRPEIYVTVIAHTPFFTSPAQQVLVQGWLLNMENVALLTRFVEKQLNILEERVALVTAIANQQLETLRSESERLVGGLFEEGGTCAGQSNSNSITNISMVSPEASFINMLRYGMLALALLPECSCANLVVVSDGIVGVTDVHVLDSLVQQLRASTVACSFLHVGSTYHPHCSNALVPYQDLLHFLATATLGTYMTFVPQANFDEEARMNVYHRNFLCWQLYRTASCDPSQMQPRPNDWHTSNPSFHGNRPPQLLRKKQIDDKVTCTLSSLLCCRLREGYLIKRVGLRDNCLELCFVLPWKTHVFLEYLISCSWPSKLLPVSNTIHYTITIEAPYEFLHDITCVSKKPIKSQYRQSVVSRFWGALASLTDSDDMLSHFSWFPGSGWTWYNVPDTIRSGMPVFYLPTYPLNNSVLLSDPACSLFGQIWRPVVLLDPSQWSRWMHSQRIALVLSHDRPLPRHLHLANQSGRFQSVQCRQAAAVLYAMLKNWATFVLVEYHTYVQFIFKEIDKPPVSFSLIRVTCKPPCVVLNIAFAGGTEGVIRHNVVVDLLECLSRLTLPNRPTEQRETPCCIILSKPLERILIRYERVPTDLNTVIFPDGTQPIPARFSPVPGGCLITTLSRYLYHSRWLWAVKKPVIQTVPNVAWPRLNVTAIARILSTITKMRLTEGFSFAHSAAGIINMVLEVQMQGPANDNAMHPCVIQYILFPPHTIAPPSSERDSGSEEDTDEGTGDGEAGTDDVEGCGDFQIVTEVWIEPQCGHTMLPIQQTAAYMHALQYRQIPDAIAQVDEECINALLTLEQLNLLSQMVLNEAIGGNIQLSGALTANQLNQTSAGSAAGRSTRRPSPAECNQELSNANDRIRSIPFTFDVLNILPKCQQAELLFSVFSDGPSGEEREGANKCLVEGLIEHIKRLHNRELIFTADESQRFTEMLLARPRYDAPALSISPHLGKEHMNGSMTNFRRPTWRCFVKGISVTHVIITILPSSEEDLRSLYSPNEQNNQNNSQTDCTDENDPLPINTGDYEKNLTPSRSVKSVGSSYALDVCSNLSSPTATMLSTPRPSERCESALNNFKQGPPLPIYVYDCPLAMLIDTLVNKLDASRVKDIYQDHTYKAGQLVGEDFITLKSEADTKPSSPEPKSDDSDNVTGDHKSMIEHCKLLHLAHCQCYVVAVYKSLASQRPLSYQDMEAAVEQCEEALIEINITNYLRSVCRHLSSATETDPESSSSALSCNDVQHLHQLITEKFAKIMNNAFRAVPAHSEFYFCSLHWNFDKMERMDLLRCDSEEDVEGLVFHSEMIDCKADHGNENGNQLNSTWPGASLQDGSKLSSLASTQSLSCDLMEDDSSSQEQPLFLQLSCSVHTRSSLSTTPVKLLPTCFTDIVEKLEAPLEEHNPAEMKITLDIICLNLPREVLDVSLERSPGLRTTSFCSASSVGSTTTNSESSPDYDTQMSGTDALQDRIQHLPRRQHNAVCTLVDEIEWLLRDETATALLDQDVPTAHTLNLVARHVSESTGRPSCSTDKVPLQFVFPSEHCSPKFLEELRKLEIDRYRINEEGSLFYFTKNNNCSNDALEINCELSNREENVAPNDDTFQEDAAEPQLQDIEPRVSGTDFGDPPGCHSEISSAGEGQTGTDDGYEGDSSDSEDDCHWLADLDKRRNRMPNFWLILKVEDNFVYVYFHCRFLELASPEVDRYRQIQKMVMSEIKAICRRVNQYLLLQSLHDTRTCDSLLEPESNEDYVWRGETGSESGATHQNQVFSINMSPGVFRCPVIWKVPFCLHPRLKTGPGKPGLSRGIKALHAVLNRFSVNNRSNMFVYQENNENVFYLRLHEQISEVKPLQNKLSESHEKLVVSRSSSITSLSQSKGKEGDVLGTNDTRPRVRSFGEKESDLLNKPDDLIILMVHGISDAGPAVKCELVQVLQNRLDDAVLEVLSIMLARNPVCKLTPADVHFIQKQYQPPENVVQLLVPPHCLPHIEALGYYLQQNLLQFLHNPKYTDSKNHNHFQDYTKDSSKRVPESDIFLYNQSQSSGSKGIACIAVGIVNSSGELITTSKQEWLDSDFPNPFKVEHFQGIVSSSLYDGNLQPDLSPEALIEFRIWKQGRVNLESLTQKLRSAARHATWDLVTEYKLLPTVLMEELPNEVSFDCTVAHKETQTPVKNKQSKPPISDTIQLNRYEVGEDGKLHEVYRTTLHHWFQFALQINVPAVKKHIVVMQRRHPIPVIAKELQSLIRGHAPDTSSRPFVLSRRQPFIDTSPPHEEIHMTKSFHMSESTESVNSSWLSVVKDDNSDRNVYVPCDLTREDQSPIKCLLVARNFYQWKASHSKTIEPEMLVPKDQKLLQKFNPLILDSSFVPRQRLLLAKIQSDNIILYMYNWSKERSEKLTKQVTNLGTWLSSRSSLFTNIAMQKLGIFHHQPAPAFPQEDRNPSYYQITDMETLTKFPNDLHNDGKEWPRTSNRSNLGKATTVSWNPRIAQVLRDAKPSGPHPVNNATDAVVRAAYRLQDVRQREKKAKEDFKCLGEMWQSRAATSNIPISQATLNLFKQHSRLIHYCHTPLLFLPKWRLQSAASRDHSLSQPPATLQSMVQQQSPQNAQAQSKTANVTSNATITEWHRELCTTMLMEYKQYLQTLGFNSVRVESSKKVKQGQNLHHTCYLQKSMLGGVLLFEVLMREPYFIAKVRVIECSRLQTKSSSALVNQFMLSFVDACDKVKIDMHLHSFTYDFHLRCIHSYIAGNGLWSLREDYDLTHFLDDFMKYYSKAPNYARNLVYSDTVTVSNLATPARTLYSYLLSNEKACGMQVLGMSRDSNEDKESEFVLVRLQSTPLVSYCDAQDMKHTNDFDITLIVSRLEQPPNLEKSEITLKYYLMLTRKREVYPKKESQNNKLGKFRTVYSISRSANNSHAESPSGSSPVSPVPSLQHKTSKTELLTSSVESSETQDGASTELGEQLKTDSPIDVNNSLAPTPPPVPSSPLTQNPSLPNAPATTSSHLVQIRQESVNYLGYYSSHEQLMQQMIMSQAHAATAKITTMIKDGALQCRTHLLWNKLLENRSVMNYFEFTELCTLAQVEPLSKIDPRLSLLLSQPLTWYQALAKVLMNKYQDHHKLFNAPDGNVNHVVVLHPSYLHAFMMLTIDLHTSRGELCAVYRKPAELVTSSFNLGDVYSLIEGFVNVCCFHLWMGLCSQ
ncbi:KICSTOR complex protein SZT2-like [Diprion similis]|uniref:KICSTOR complex protein SZT2-like n=1 Tax=Diprion similis TaxID=362088 RepID=UPI001EF91E11|nr:KICSTOR complex protein SZT2-like [Diprion similis]